LIDTGIILSHTLSGEPVLEAPAYAVTVGHLHAIDGAQRFVLSIDHEASNAIFDHLGYRTAAEGDGLVCRKPSLPPCPKQLGPVYRE
jgi:hypothetical protein